jgi:hypothetical protein
VDPKTKAEALTLATTMDARKALAAEWACQYRAQRRPKPAAQMDGLVQLFERDAYDLRRLAETLPE